MTVVGTFEAKTHLSGLLDRVSRGEEVTITRHGKAVARLVGVQDPEAGAVDIAAKLKAHRKRNTLAGLDWKALRDEGRR